ncbi:MAG: extracellular solute-binding protein [Propionicimonas sp.]|uniref:extracellular solute-binding protein n=1 Tax=Propionicimonas sp. TaxID=1955623 RepID=UPI002B1FA9D4|nr:extracellular solute-binding protein [Propionicimonas sp.]MEA4944307.1 extracellular solute-binding protein [Propionicimonas sp.]
MRKPGIRRTWLAGLTAAMAATVLVGCSTTAPGTSAPAGGGTTEINALFMKQAGYSEEQINEMLDAFTKANPTIKVNPTYVAYEALHDKIVTSAPAGTYDVVLIDVIWPAEFAKNGIVLDVTDKYPAEWKDQMLGGAYSTAQYDGKFWGVPWGPSTKFFYYNKELVEKVGATQADLDTWDGVLAVAKKLKDASYVQYPLAWSWAQAEAVICDYGQLLGAMGGQFTGADGTLSVNTGPGVQALEWMKKSLDDGLTNPASTTFLEDDVQKSLAQGETAFALNWEATFAALQDSSQSNVVGKIGLLPTPKGPNGDRPGINGAMALSIPAKSAHVDQAWQLITYLTSQENQNKYPTGWLPNWKSSYTNQSITKNAPELFTAAETGYASLILRPTVPNYNSTSADLQLEIQNALTGQKTPQQALDDAVAAANG